MTSDSAYLLVFHGSRDFNTQKTVLQLAQLLTKKLTTKNIVTQGNYLVQDDSTLETQRPTRLSHSKKTIVATAALELTSIALHKSIIKLAEKIQHNGGESLQIVPLFLNAGVHVREDLPREIALAETTLDNQVTLKLSPYLGKYSGMLGLLHRKFTQLSGDGRILLAHGSSIPEVKQQCQMLGAKLQAAIAYWSMPPSLSEQIEIQIAAGKKQIAILPYFLFPGKITKAIATEVEQLRAAFPEVELILGQPLGVTSELAKLIAEEI
ncbi:MAG: sirohydrochlorin chelatase [Pleurocapsa sp.]